MRHFDLWYNFEAPPRSDKPLHFGDLLLFYCMIGLCEFHYGFHQLVLVLVTFFVVARKVCFARGLFVVTLFFNDFAENVIHSSCYGTFSLTVTKHRRRLKHEHIEARDWEGGE